ncbi:GAF domain-containing sensor histidine kinase [Paenibacillus sedimenti]|uniref:Oxygen sensor histidine kinase NreB n=1 Tax=Paenibacillus sedimenti TaxID=2770274 RepID=A0A926KVJ4_9BACL|nr:GAF domain-containing sensor histidine kinase [Paenibacillus sedimenti]MBD0383956.1 sensor histidine kinase [Paenibacillus sedimenti]
MDYEANPITKRIFPEKSHPVGWLFVLRILSLAFSCFITILFLAKLPAYYLYMRDTCHQSLCEYAAITPLPKHAAEAFGLKETGFAALYAGIAFLFFLLYSSVATLILVKRPREPISYITAVALVSFPASTFISMQWRELGWLTSAVEDLSLASFILFLLLFPNGRIVRKGLFWAGVGLMAIRIVSVYFPFEPWGAQYWPLWCNLLWVVLQYGILIYNQYVRYRFAGGAVERQQTKWFVYGVLLSLTCVFLVSVIPLFIQADFYEVKDPLRMFILDVAVQIFMLPIPVTLGISILRKRLWDIDPIVNRTLVYLGLSASIIALYALIVWYLSILFQTEQNMLFSIFATGVAAVVFAPLKERLQRAVNRMLYGEQHDPFSVLLQLGNRLKESISPEAALDTVVKTVKDSLRVPYAGISLAQNGLETSTGKENGDITRIPLMSGGSTVGSLHIAARSPGEAFNDADLKLIDGFARQAGIVVHNVKQAMDIRLLLTDLQESKEQLIFAQEEERRSIRKNLHDDIAPRLAAMRLTASLVTDWIRKDPNKAIEIITQFKQDIAETVEEIRGIVYDLRPPALDELGLIGAVRQRMEQLQQLEQVKGITDSVPLRFTFDSPDRLPMLPAAVEVGAYRIATEALVNVVKHARADTCVIRIAVETDPDRELVVEVTDNGVGLPDQLASTDGNGLGLTSLWERARELGGTCVVGNLAGGGMRVQARLPLKG